METATKTGIEKVEDLLLKKFGIKKTDDPIPGDRRTGHCGGIIYRL